MKVYQSLVFPAFYIVFFFFLNQEDGTAFFPPTYLLSQSQPTHVSTNKGGAPDPFQDCHSLREPLARVCDEGFSEAG